MGRDETFIGSGRRLGGVDRRPSCYKVPRCFHSNSEDLNMADSADPKYLDKRTAERYLRSGQLDEKAYERHVKSLPDVADKSVPVETHMLDDVDDFEDDEDDIDEDEDESDEGSDDEGSASA
jgi:hypothetical protein